MVTLRGHGRQAESGLEAGPAWAARSLRAPLVVARAVDQQKVRVVAVERSRLAVARAIIPAGVPILDGLVVGHFLQRAHADARCRGETFLSAGEGGGGR